MCKAQTFVRVSLRISEAKALCSSAVDHGLMTCAVSRRLKLPCLAFGSTANMNAEGIDFSESQLIPTNERTLSCTPKPASDEQAEALWINRLDASNPSSDALSHRFRPPLLRFTDAS